jgi:hypothetical protein
VNQNLELKYPNPADPSQPFFKGNGVLNKGFKNIWKGLLWLFRQLIK